MDASAHPVLSNKHLYFNFQTFTSSQIGSHNQQEKWGDLGYEFMLKKKKKRKQFLNTVFQGKGIW